jgi:putative ABC transport system permease protein
VIGEVALAVVALIGAGLFVHSMRNLQSVDPGFESENLALFNVNLGNAGYSRADGEHFYDNLMEQLGSLPGVTSAAYSSGRILGGGLPHTTFPEGVDIAGGRGLHVQDIIVSPEYFATAGIPLVSGRLFTEFDRASTQRVAVINEATRRLFWPDVDPIGRRFTRTVEDFTIEVVGVVGDALIDLSESAQPIIYTTTEQFYQSGVQVLVRTAGDPNSTLGAIQRTARQLDPTLPLLGLTTIGDNMREALWAPRLGAGMLGVFGVLAMVLAMVGIYGVMSYSVRQRHHELGLRMAFGAAPAIVLKLVLSHGMKLVAIGLLVGIVLSAVATRLIQSLLFDIRAVDPVTFLVVSLVLFGAAFAANLGPALHVTRIDPVVALREE